MKKLFLFAAAGSILLVSACNSIDPKVVDSVQTSINKVQENKSSIESAAQNVANLREQMDAAPAGLKGSDQFGYAELSMGVDAFIQRYAVFQESQANAQTKLESLLADYTDGKIKKEALEEEQKSLQQTIDGTQAALDRMTTMFDDLSARFAKMSATWKSLPEEERTALTAKAAETVPQDSPRPAATPGSLQTGPTPQGVVRPQTSNSLLRPPGSKQ